MPKVVNIPNVGQVNFPDDMTDDQIVAAIETDILPQFQSQPTQAPVEQAVVQATPLPPDDISFSDLARRVPAGISQSTADAAAGVIQFGQDIYNIPGQLRVDATRMRQSSALQDALQGMGTPEGAEAYRQYLRERKAGNQAQASLQENRPMQGVVEFAQDVSARSAEEYGVDPSRDQQLASQVASGVGSLVTAMGTGPLAPLTMAGMMAESGRSEAEEAGATPAQQRSAFYANAAVGALSEALMGVPALLRSARANGIPAETLRGLVTNASRQAVLSFGREGTQEGIEQFAQNIVASDIAAYDPKRPAMQGVGTAALVGGIIGAPTGAVVQVAEDIDSRPLAPLAEEKPDLKAVAAALDDDVPEAAPAAQAAPPAQEAPPVEEAPPIQAAPPNPVEQASAQLLGQDNTELRQQEAIINGQPVPLPTKAELEATQAAPVTEEVAPPADPIEETVTEPVTEPELVTPEGLTALEPDSYERLADQPVQEGFRALQDQETFDVFQVPENATPEQIEAARQQARQEGEQLARQYEMEEQRRLRQEEYENGQRELQALQSVVNRDKPAVQKTIPEPQFRNLWDNPENLKRVLDQQEQNLRRAQGGTLRDPSGQVVTPQQLEPGVQALRDRYQELTGKQEAAKEAIAELPAAPETPIQVPRDARDSTYEKLLGKGKPVGKNLYELSEKDVTPALRRKLASERSIASGLPSSPQETEAFLLRPKADVTGNPYDKGYILRDKRPDYIERNQGMKRGNRGEQGSTTIPQAITEFASAIYRQGVEFKDWSRQMLRSLGQNIRPFLQDIWNGLTGAVNALSPSQRARVETRMQRRNFSEGGAVGSAGSSTAVPPATPSAQQQSSPAPDEQPIGVANAQTEAARQRIGLDPRFTPARRTFGTVWDEAMAKIAADPNYPTKLIDSLAIDPRPTTDLEVATLVYARVLAEQSYDASVNEVNSATNEADGIHAQALLQRSKQDLDKIYTVAESVGTATSRGLNARKLLVNRDLTLAEMRAETRAIENQGQPLTPEQEKRIDELHAQLSEAKKKIAELEEKQSKQQAEMTFSAMMKEFRNERKEAVKNKKSVTEFLNEQAEKSRQAIREMLGTMNAGVNPAILWHASVIGASYIANGINTASEFASRIIADLGDAIEPHIPEIFKSAQEIHESESQKFKKTEDSQPAEGAGSAKAAKEETPEQIIARATGELDPKLVFDLARAYVRQGMTGADNVMSAVHQALLPAIPELTLREVRDAFSGYGKVKYPSKADDLVKLREYRTLARLTSQLEDVQSKIAPLRTGMQRDKMTAEARLLQKQINDLMKKYDLRPTDPLQQLKTSREAVKARLRNEIEELERSLSTRTRRPQNRNPIEYDAETKALQERRSQLRERYEEMFPRQPMSPEQRIKQMLNSLDRSIAEETQMLKDGILKRPARPDGPTSSEIENKRMELDALRQLRRELFAATQPKKSAEDVALEQAIKAAQESIKRMDEMMRTGNIDPKTKTPRFTPTGELESLWMERDAMRDALAELRKANKPRKDAEDTARKKAVNTLTKAIEDLDRRIAAGDFSARPKKATRPEVREVAELRASKEAMRQVLNDMKKAATPTRSPEEIKLSRDKKNISRRIEQLQEKIRNSDYTVRPKPDPVMDKEKLELQRQYQAVRKEYLKGLFEAQLRQRTLAGKLWGSTKEALNTSRSILTSMDLSGVLRQGGFIVFGNPVRAAKALPAMFKAFASEAAHERVMLEIQNRPNYPLYQQAKLYLADTAPASLSQMEEAYMSRWSNRIPGVAGSQRAYVTFLNKLRADSFDAMIAGLAKNGIPTKEESRAVANYVNIATGRGDLGKFAGAGEMLNTVFFAPRYVASRFQLLAGQPLYGGTARTRKMIALEYAKFLGGVSAAVALAALAGDDEERGEIFGIPVPIETDPRSADFLKVRFGNTRLDMLAGLIQTTVVTARLTTRQMKRGNGQIMELTGQDRKISDPSWMDTLGRFLRSKLSPVLGTIFDIGAGENLIGEPVTPAKALVRGVVPLSISEIDETMREQGIPKGAALQILSLFGVGLQTYEQRQSKSSRSNPYSSN